MKNTERMLRGVVRYLSEPGYRAGNPMDARKYGTRKDNVGVLDEAGKLAASRRRGAHFITIDVNPYVVTTRKREFRVEYEGKERRRSLRGRELRKRAQIYADYLNDTPPITPVLSEDRSRPATQIIDGGYPNDR